MERERARSCRTEKEDRATPAHGGNEYVPEKSI
nr:MAG TPA: hypothetical protein [Caudoviricetes sp.]DAZ37775.1 MAG TPA: hypothetical protein [Caudoviricetes sp.]